MATSDSVDFNRTRDQIIVRALRQIGAIEAGETPEAEDVTTASEALNSLVKGWQADGIHLWTRREATLFLTPEQRIYLLGPNSSDHAAETNEVTRTQLDGDAAASATTITVDSTDDIAVGDNIGVVLDDDTLHWTTVSSISGNDITINDGLPSKASDDNFVYAYTDKLDRPLRVIDVRRWLEDSDTSVPIITVDHKTYFELPNKEITGEANQVYYHPEIPDGRLYVWPVPDSVGRTLRLTCLLPLEDFDDADNDPDFPREWLNALTWNLADELAIEYGAPERVIAHVNARAGYWYQKVLMWDQEPESVYFAPNLTHQWGD